MALPQLKIRSEYSMQRTAFGPVSRIGDRLQSIGCTTAGMVEAWGGTWGHVQYEKAMKARGITPAFGAEFIVRRGEKDIPTCWALAEDPAALYRETTNGFKFKYYGATTTESRMAAAKGLIRFAGAALTDPETFDYVDANPGSRRLQRAAADLAARTGKPLVLTSDNYYPAAEDRRAFQLFAGTLKPSPQHILDDDELRAAFPMLDDAEFFSAVCATFEVAERLQGVKLRRAPVIRFDGDLRALCEEGKRVRNIPGWNSVYDERLERELKMIASKEFESYFLMVADLVAWAKQRMLVGPARGSSAGSLVCYLLRITEVDPIPYGLIFERFVDVTRADLPDIDIDFPDTSRDECYSYLTEKYGAANVARVGTVGTYRARKALDQGCKELGIPKLDTFALKQSLIERSKGDAAVNDCLVDTLETTEAGRFFASKFPAAALIGELEGHVENSGQHAAGVCVCNEPLENFCTVADGVMHLDKDDAEALGLLKIDALGLKTLGVISSANVVPAEVLYGLKMDDPKVFEVFQSHRYAGLFQWEGRALQGITNRIDLTKFSDLDQITALARPGPLGGGAAERFIARHNGREEWQYPHPSLGAYLDESFGLLLYQEQVLRICRELAGMSWEDVTGVRKAMAKSQGDEVFAKYEAKFIEGTGRLHGVKAKDASAIWAQMRTMGSYSFNKSHSVSYSVISYWTAYLKCYFPLEYAAAALRNADDEGRLALLRELDSEGIGYVPFDMEKSQAHWAAVDGQLIGGFQNLVGYGASKAAKAVKDRDAGRMIGKTLERVQAAENPFVDLYPLRARYSGYFREPEAHGLGDRVTSLADVRESDDDSFIFIVNITKMEEKDENVPERVARRNGKILNPSRYVDLKAVDDTVQTPILLRIDRRDYDKWAPKVLQRLKIKKHDLLVRAKKVPGFPMCRIENMKCLNDPELFA